MARSGKKKGWLIIQLAVVGLLTLKLVVAGFDFGRGWIDHFFKPSVAQAQQAKKEDPKKTEAKKEDPKAKKGEKDQKEGAEKGQEDSAKPAKQLGPEQLEVLRSIENLKKKLEEREKELDKRASELSSLEKLVDQKMATLEKLKVEFEAQVKAEEERQNKRIKHLVALYSNMKPKAAAEVMEKMDLDLAVEIFRQMRGREAGKILANVSPEKASKISQMLSEKVEN